MIRDWLARAGAALRRLAVALHLAPSLEARTRRAAELLSAALGEDDAARRVEKLRAALAAGEALAGPAGDITVLEASLHLGEKLRALGARDEAIAHFARAVERSYRVGDPVGRQRRAGVLTRLAILDQEAGHLPRARQRYSEALALGSDADSSLLLGMLTQAAFNLGLLDTEAGDEQAAARDWESALELGARAGHPSGWDPAAVAAFNLGFLYLRRGDAGEARDAFVHAVQIAEPAATPLGLMAAAKAELALAGLAERDGLAGEPEALHHNERAWEFGLACPLPEGALAAIQAALAIGEQWLALARWADCVARYREALTLVPRCEGAAVARYHVLLQLRLGQVLGEQGERPAAALHLADAWTRGRESDEPWVRELAAQAACSLHRVWFALERWDDARALADEASAFAETLGTGTGRALAAAARYARAYQRVHDGDVAGARAELAAVADAGFASGVEVGERVGLDALLLAGHLERRAGRDAEAIAIFRDALARLRERRGGEADGMAALAALHLGHALLALERGLEARYAYEQALARGRASGAPGGRAAAANAALNLATVLADELDDARRHELWSLALVLGRSSGTALGEQVEAAAAKALRGESRGDEPLEE